MQPGVFVLATAAACALQIHEQPAMPEGPRTAAELWGGGRKSHPAVLNPAVGYPDGKVIRLDGEWDFLACDQPSFGGSPFRKPHTWSMGFFTNWSWRAEQSRHITVKPRKITVPGTWEAQGIGSNGMSVCWQSTDNSPKLIRHKYMGDAWYRKCVEVPAEWKDGRVWLKLGGLRGLAHVWVNGAAVALINDYCATRKFDVTDLIGDDRVCDVIIELNNIFATNNGYFTGMHRWGGICRVPELEVTTRDCWIDDAWVRGDFDKRLAEAHVEIAGWRGGEVEKWSGGKVRVTVEGETKEVALHSTTTTSNYNLEVPLRNFRPWSPESPNLYTAKVELVSTDGKVLETRYERFGVRKLEVAGADFRMNGKPLYLRGFGDDAVYPLTGMPLGEHAFYRPLLSKARAAGFNQVRTHTHCEFPEYFDLCDELGIIVQPELPYYCDFVPDGGEYDPPKHLVELYENYRRHPSFGIYGMGNEGSHGKVMDRYLHELAHKLDPDRLAMNQSGDYDGGRCTNGVEASGFQDAWRADFVALHPIAWARNCPDLTRPYTVHEYLNLCTKLDYRDEPKYTGAWMPPVTEKMRRDWLGRFGLGLGWGARLQDAQIRLQRHWQQMGVEAARLDAACDGFCFWTIVDVTVWNPKSETYSAQGLFNPLWETKRGGFTAEEFAAFNSPSCVMAKTPDDNRVYAVGETISADVFFAHYGEAPLERATLGYALRTDGGTLAAGSQDIGTQELGAVRKVAALSIPVPNVDRPQKVRLTLTVGPASNGYDLWLFPANSLSGVKARAAACGVVIATAGSPEAETAEKAGHPAVIVGEAKGVPNVKLGWWWMGPQVGTAFRDDPALAGLPHEGYLSPLVFRIFGIGQELPQEEWREEDLLIVTEGGEKCFVNLAGRALPDGGRLFKSYGLDLLADKPEANALLDSLVKASVRSDP